MSRSFLPTMLVATFFWLLLAFFWEGALASAAWCAGCAWTAWQHPARHLTDQEGQNR
jgi:hypothetical protein